MFRPARVRRLAETLAAQLSLPRIDVPGLVIQAPGDEASMALSSVASFAKLARFVRSRILTTRSFDRRQEQMLHRARTSRDVAIALYQALALVPASAFWLWLLSRGLESRQWLLFTVAIPMAIVSVTGALATVGGSVLLLLLLPACSFLLWPFGISPTAAAALLTVSIDESPSRRWKIVRLTRTSAATTGWKHSTYANPLALAAACAYLRSVMGTHSTFYRPPTWCKRHRLWRRSPLL
jgi:hypothetical protein